MEETCITIWHFPTHERWFDEGTRRSLRLIAEAGFTHVNWNCDAGHSYIYAPSEIEFIGQLLEESGLRAWSIHGSNGQSNVSEVISRDARSCVLETRKNFLSPIEWQRQAGLDLIRNRLTLAKRIGAPNVVMHVELTDAVMMDNDAKLAAFEVIHRSFDDLRDDCESAGVRIAVENLPQMQLAHTLELLSRIFERHPESQIGLCYDSGHAELADPHGFQILEAFGERLITTHLHDNHGATDDHLLPWDGVIDWDRLLDLIAGTPCPLPLNFETPYKFYGHGYSVSETAFYSRAYNVISRAEQRVRRIRDDAPVPTHAGQD